MLKNVKLKYVKKHIKICCKTYNLKNIELNFDLNLHRQKFKNYTHEKRRTKL